MIRSRVTVVQFLFFFVVLWTIAFLYLTTWEATLFRNLQRESFFAAWRSRMSDLLQLRLRKKAITERERQIEKFHERLNLTSPGDMGKPVILPKILPADIQKLISDGKRDYKINEFVSNLIPLSRSLPDPRDEYCSQQVYESLPKASVIIIFHNEAWSMVKSVSHAFSYLKV